jgi:hypothetical protein
MLGLDVTQLDVSRFIDLARLFYVLATLVWLAALTRIGRPVWLLVGVVLANALAWGVTNYPLQRLYALGPSHDRVWNLGFCQVVAAGNSPLHTPQVGQLHFEPFWGLLVAATSGWSPDRVLVLYPFYALAMPCAFALSLYWGLAPSVDSPWARALASGFATLVSSDPLDFTGAYRVPWAMTFLLKPNHALGLVLLPVFLRCFAAIRGWRSRLAVGLLLNLLGWVFVLHMVYVCFGLLVYAAASLLRRDADARRVATDAAVVILVNVAVVSPYLYMLVAGYPFTQASPRMAIPPWSPHLLEVTTRSAVLTALGGWGLFVLDRRADRLSRVWVAQVAGAYVLWIAYLGLSALQQAREKDELFYWLRFLMAASAAVGTWDLATRCTLLLRRPLSHAHQAAAIAVLAMPWSLPYWWDPIRMDAYFVASIPPVPATLRDSMEYLRRRTPPAAVVAGAPEMAGWVAALGARRVLLADGLHSPPAPTEREALETRLLERTDPADVNEAAARYGVRYLVVTPAVLARHQELTLSALEARPSLERVHLWGTAADFVAIFRVRVE